MPVSSHFSARGVVLLPKRNTESDALKRSSRHEMDSDSGFLACLYSYRGFPCALLHFLLTTTYSLSPSLTESATKEKHPPRLKKKDMEKNLDRQKDGVTDIIRLFALEAPDWLSS